MRLRCDVVRHKGWLFAQGSTSFDDPIMPHLNSGKNWSEMDLQDLRDGLRLRSPMQELAEFLMRDIEEVRAKAAELQAEQE